MGPFVLPDEAEHTVYWHILDHGKKNGSWKPPLSNLITFQRPQILFNVLYLQKFANLPSLQESTHQFQALLMPLGLDAHVHASYVSHYGMNDGEAHSSGSWNVFRTMHPSMSHLMINEMFPI